MNESWSDCSTVAIAAPVWQETILLVEDDERVRYALQFFLQNEGFEVIGAGSVAEAEKYITVRGPKNISAIISDIYLDPVTKTPDGYGFYQSWTAEDPDLPFILISGDPTVWELPAVRSQEVCFLPKPFNFHELLAAVRSILDERSAADMVTRGQNSTKNNSSEKEN